MITDWPDMEAYWNHHGIKIDQLAESIQIQVDAGLIRTDVPLSQLLVGVLAIGHALAKKEQKESEFSGT